MFYTNRAVFLKTFRFSKKNFSNSNRSKNQNPNDKDNSSHFLETANSRELFSSLFSSPLGRLEDVSMFFAKKSILNLGLMTLLCLSFFGSPVHAQTLAVGDFAVVPNNKDGVDGFSFVTLVDLPVTTYFITEQGWKGSTYKWATNTEPHVPFTTNTNYQAGTIFLLTDFGIN